MSYSISISGHAAKASPKEIADEARKFIKALDGVNYASLSDVNGTTDLTKDSES